MKRLFSSLLCLWCVLLVPAYGQQMPAEWARYADRSRYFHDFRTDHNSRSTSESLFCENLRQAAIVGLAQQIEVSVGSNSTTEKAAYDGRSHTTYHSTSTLSTSADLQLVQTEVRYDRTTGEGVAIAWIEKQAARTHYFGEVQALFAEVGLIVRLAEGYAAEGYAHKASEELKGCEQKLERVEWLHSRLSLFGLSEVELNTITERRGQLVATIREHLKEWRHSLTVCVECGADLFGSPFVGFADRLKGGMAADGCNFVATTNGADWGIVVSASAREYNTRNVGGVVLYTAYVDATLTLTNCKTGQVVCADEVSVKGSHTVNYTQAARTAYADVQKKLLEKINEYIN